jgi:hypothetical protein
LLDRPVQRGPIDLGERGGLSDGELGHTILIPHYLPNNRYTTYRITDNYLPNN